MGNIAFNISKDRIGYYASLPAANDGLVMVPLESSGLEADDTLADYADLGSLLASTNNEQTTMGRKAMTGVTVTRDNTANTVSIDADDVSWSGASGNQIGAMVMCYDPDTTAGTDSDLVPLAKWDFVSSPSGGTVAAQIAVAVRYG